MTHTPLLGYFDSLWHYGLPSSPPRLHSNFPSPCAPILSMISSHDSLLSLFALLDEDGDGQLSVREILSLLARLGFRSISQSENELFSLIQSVLSPKTTPHHPTSTSLDMRISLDFQQFAQLYGSLFASQISGDGNFDDDLLDAFQIYDLNRDGFISAAELAAVLTVMKLLPAYIDGHHQGVEAHVGRCQAYIDSVDLDGNGLVDLEEFKAMMMSSWRSSPLCKT